jgi:hypothetical protein
MAAATERSADVKFLLVLFPFVVREDSMVIEVRAGMIHSAGGFSPFWKYFTLSTGLGPGHRQVPSPLT